jgi:hypothetical protein
MKITQREMILGVATLTAVLTGFTWVTIDKKTDEWKTEAGRIEQAQQQIRHYQAAIRMQDEWLDELNALQEDLRVFEADERSVSPDLMKIIKTISSEHELEITRSQPYKEKLTGSLFELGINCTWQGTLDSMVGFLAELQQQGVSYDVRQLNVTPAGKDTGKLKGNMVIHCAYTRVSSEDIDSQNSPAPADEAPQAE